MLFMPNSRLKAKMSPSESTSTPRPIRPVLMVWFPEELTRVSVPELKTMTSRAGDGAPVRVVPLAAPLST